jgi:alpha/beta hydrolase fold
LQIVAGFCQTRDRITRRTFAMSCYAGRSSATEGVRRALACLFLGLILAVNLGPMSAAKAGVEPFSKGFNAQQIATNGTTLYVRIGGQGPAVVMLHGFGDTGDMWAPLAAVLMKDHTIIIPDLRGMGLSAHPDGGYTKKNQGLDIAGILDRLKIEKADLVT